MSTPYRLFEILLPLRFNDGSPEPGDLLADTFIELRMRFGAVSSKTQLTQRFQQIESWITSHPIDGP